MTYFRQIYSALGVRSVPCYFVFLQHIFWMMDACEVHKKIQKTVMAVEIYKLKIPIPSSMWHEEIVKGPEKLAQERHMLAPLHEGLAIAWNLNMSFSETLFRLKP